MKSIDQIINACDRCIGCKPADSCYGCPYESEDKCYDRLCEDVIFQLKRLKKLETPTEKEQPVIPGLEVFTMSKDAPSTCYVIIRDVQWHKTLSQECINIVYDEKEAAAYCKDMNNQNLGYYWYQEVKPKSFA